MAIIGAGPIGIELAVALRQAGIDYLHLEAGQIGQTIYDFPPQMRFFSSPRRIAIAGVRLEGAERRPVFDERTMQTNVPGVFVAGTLSAGTQTDYGTFLENCHIHVARILAALTGAPPPPEAPPKTAQPES